MVDLNSKVIVLQPVVPLYREAFFRQLSSYVDLTIYTFYSKEFIQNNNMASANIKISNINSVSIGRAIFVNIIPFIFGNHKIVILCAEMKILTNWLILIFGRVFGKKIILWGHGLNVKRYDYYKDKMPFIMKSLFRLADEAWFYTNNELKIWERIIPNLKSVSLNNTIDTTGIRKLDKNEKHALKSAYGINQDIVLIFCARFSNPNRRIDLLLKIMEQLEENRFGFIILGDGVYKPDFSTFENVYDFGSNYIRSKKNELFGISDIYVQPAWTGLSIVEAMAYGKPVFTFERSNDIMQCVEYGYIKNGYNGIIFKSINEFVDYLNNCNHLDINELGNNACAFVQKELSMDNMVLNAVKGIKMLKVS